MARKKTKEEKRAAAKARRTASLIKRSLAGAAILLFAVLFATGWYSREAKLAEFKDWCMDHPDRPKMISPEMADKHCSCMTKRLGERFTAFDTAISRATLFLYNPAARARENFDVKFEGTLCMEQVTK
jgi:hypothetical protein